ncbi:hypothetical protein [Rhabdothermincola salaria]|uniref:hypothetical protein n=1 Tax=Rhabdothermincola salaria TaxID=2903142 RepID=UPI001E4D0B4F|nr:hypothetical protein [Rhabdothermincola salaria]MCD9623287.1 hypothetical protein [Rhabdothermincola salaria]
MTEVDLTFTAATARLSTWLFLGALGAATAGVLAFYGRSIQGWTGPAPRTDLVTPGHFVRMRGHHLEVDLGRGWRATDDPGAAWHLWWASGSGELVGLRYSALPPPPGPLYLGSVSGRTLLDPMGVHHFTGMRVLGHCDRPPTRAECDELRGRPDGIDLLVGGTHGALAETHDLLDGSGHDGDDAPAGDD